jgi:hypothetical protein
MPLSRRTALALGGTTLASVVALPGCLDAGDGSDPGASTGTATATDDPRATGTPGSTPTPTQRGLRLAEALVVPELVVLDTADALGTVGGRAERFLLVRASAPPDEAPSVDAFELDTDQGAYTPATDLGGGYDVERLRTRRPPYDGSGEGWLVFRLPAPLVTDRATLRWPDGERPLDAAPLARLTRGPTTFAVDSFAAPASVVNGETATLTVDVANTGATDGTFVAALNRSGPLVASAPEAAVELDVPAGETRTWSYEYTPDVSYRDENGEIPDVRFRLRWRGGAAAAVLPVTVE